MESSSRGLIVYAAAVTLFLIVIAIWTAFSLIPRTRRAAPLSSRPDGHFRWARSEMEQIADARNPSAPPQTDARHAAAMMRIDLEVEVGRIISELSAEPRSGSRALIVEALGRGIELVRSYATAQRRLAELGRAEPADSRPPPGVRFDQLRRAMELDDGHALPRRGGGLIASRSH
jgi:hypothetical protein